MEIYTLDNLLRRTEVIDRYESLVWTERFSAAGDFELSLQSTPGNRALFRPETWLALNESVRVMKVETCADSTDEDGKRILKVSGPSIELPVLDDRVAFNVKDDLVTNPKWTITNTPAAIARKVFQDICVTGVLDADDVIPFISSTSVLPDDTIPEPSDVVTMEIEPASVYNVIKQICEPYDLGFRLIRNYDASQLVFDIYTGIDRTSTQSIVPVVQFSSALGTLKNHSSLESTAGMKTHAYVYSNLGFEEVVALDVDPSLSGFERKVLVVKMDDFDDGTPAGTVTSMMQAKGREELAKLRKFIGYDGEITPNSPYRYGVDYQLGDLVERHDDEGNSSVVRVTEQIFASDAEGDRSYPTLSIKKNVTSGSWGEMGTQQWVDFADDLTTYWSSMP